MNCNCREDNICAFCKYWLGSEPQPDYVSGECKVTAQFGHCKKDTSEGRHKTTDLCHQFSRALRFM